MKYILITVSLFTCVLTSKAQVNLILNPSFEKFSECPSEWDEIKFANNWMSLDSAWSPPDWTADSPGVPDYCNVCADSNVYVGIPSGAYSYFHYPRTGNGMVQVIMFYDNVNPLETYQRDYLQGHLLTSLTAGQSYCATFYVALEQGSGYAINHLGAYFDDGTIDTTHRYGLPQTQYSPQILDTNIILDTVPITDTLGFRWQGQWVKVQGSFIANGTERLITIGNFFDDAHTNVLPLYDTVGRGFVGVFTWYLIDDVSVIKSDAIANAGPDQVITGGITDSVIIGDTLDTYMPVYWYVNGSVIDSNKASLKVRPDTTTKYVMALDVCGNITYDTVVVWDESLNNVQVNKLVNVQIFPNPATNQLNVEYAKGCELLMYDMLGKIAYQTFISSDKQVVDISLLQGGVYVVQVVDPLTMSRVIKKVIKE